MILWACVVNLERLICDKKLILNIIVEAFWHKKYLCMYIFKWDNSQIIFGASLSLITTPDMYYGRSRTKYVIAFIQIRLLNLNNDSDLAIKKLYSLLK